MPKIKSGGEVVCKTSLRKSSFTVRWTIEGFSKIKEGISLSNAIKSPDWVNVSIKKINRRINQALNADRNANNFRKMMRIKLSSCYDCNDATLSVAVYDKDLREICKPSVTTVVSKPLEGHNFFIFLRPDDGSYDLENIEGDILTFLFNISYKRMATETCVAPQPRALKINNLSTLSMDFKRLYDSCFGTDIVFRVKGVSFPAHKAILLFRSEYFKSMFSNNMKEASADQVEIHDIEPDIFRYVLEYLYSGIVPSLPFSTAHALYSAAQMYCLTELRQICKNMLLAQLNSDNAPELLSIADVGNDKEMLSEVVKFINYNKLDVRMTNYVRKRIKKEMSGEEIKDLLLNVIQKTL